MVDYDKLILIFTSIIYEALPFIVLGVIIAGLLEEFVPQQMIARMIPRSRAAHIASIAVGGLLGLIFPMCECGIIAVMRRLLRKGVPLSVCLCYMLAGPIINLVVISSTAVAFQADTTLGPGGVVALRVGLGFVVAFVTALIVDRMYARDGNKLLTPLAANDASRHEAANDDERLERKSLLTRVGNVTETALHDFIDIMAFLVLGSLIAAVARIAIPALQLDDLLTEMPYLTIPCMMAFAVLFCLCSEADAFVAVNFQPITLWPPASKIAFLVLGPMLDFKLLLMYTRVFRRKLILTIVVCLVVQVWVYTTVLHVILEATAQAVPAETGKTPSTSSGK